MRLFVARSISHLKGKISLPGDKSIAHRAIILSSLSKGKTEIENFPANKDCLSTVSAFRKLGIKINISKKVTVSGNGLYGLKKPGQAIFAGESGTTIRLLLGVLAGQSFKTRLVVGKSLSNRPMLRVTAPLRLMGAKIVARHRAQGSRIEEYPPLIIQGGNLRPISYKMPVASAQVKSAILLAALFAKGKTRIIEPVATRDHTEKMLELFKADIKLNRNNIVIKGGRELFPPGKIIVPGDISSAAFFIVLGALVSNSEIQLKNISLNPSRIGVIRVLKRMKADIKITVKKSLFSKSEPAGDILVKTSVLRAAKVNKEEVPSLIDELPVLMVAACFAKGKTVFEGVNELRVKETDRVNSIVSNLKLMGADINVFKRRGLECVEIKGAKSLKGAKVKSFNDHRTAMSMIVAGLAAKGNTYLDDVSCISKSFPDFLKNLDSLINIS